MSEDAQELSQAMKYRIAQAALVAAEQLRLAEELVVEVGVGGKHERREELVLAAMQVIATNFLALQTRS